MSSTTDRLGAHEDAFLIVSPDDPRARVLFDDLEREYDGRYSDLMDEPAATELHRYPSSTFLPPDGAFVLLARDGAVVAGGAFMRFDERTAEFKRIWTHPDHRRRGLSRRVLAELERIAATQGYSRVYLTTGPRQPEAVALYASAGYTVLPLLHLGGDFHAHPFEKALDPA
jgi:GNAT superfamily N-acetyltransferase